MGDYRVDWQGSFAVIVTPFTNRGDIDEDGYRRVVESVIEAGCHGVISAGSTGEFFLMTNDERKRVFEVAVDQTAGRVPVLAGTSATRTEDVIDLTRSAAALGCDGAMVLPPIYAFTSDEEVIEFYRRVVGESGLPVMLYNSPKAVRAYLTPQIVEQLMAEENVVAIKDSSLELEQLSGLLKNCGDELRVFVGHEDWILPGVALGAAGAVAMMPQVVGRMAVELYEAAARGDLDKARELHFKMVRVYDLFKVGSGYIAIKEAMNILGKPGGHPRPPMLPFTDEQRGQIREILEEVNILVQASVV